MSFELALKEIDKTFTADDGMEINIRPLEAGDEKALLGFTHLMRLEDYVQDMQAIQHDYVLMGMDLKTDEEYAGMG